jgi:hypothetical protein
VISEEKFKGAVYSINTGQNGITMFSSLSPGAGIHRGWRPASCRAMNFIIH